VIAPWQRTFIEKRKAQARAVAEARPCDHCCVGKANGTRLHDGKILWLCIACAGSAARTGRLP